MHETVVSDLIELIADERVADPSKPEAYIGLAHIPEGAIRLEKVGTIEAIRGHVRSLPRRRHSVRKAQAKPSQERPGSRRRLWDRQRYSCYGPRPVSMPRSLVTSFARRPSFLRRRDDRRRQDASDIVEDASTDKGFLRHPRPKHRS